MRPAPASDRAGMAGDDFRLASKRSVFGVRVLEFGTLEAFLRCVAGGCRRPWRTARWRGRIALHAPPAGWSGIERLSCAPMPGAVRQLQSVRVRKPRDRGSPRGNGARDPLIRRTRPHRCGPGAPRNGPCACAARRIPRRCRRPPCRGARGSPDRPGAETGWRRARPRACSARWTCPRRAAGRPPRRAP
jgi:hypothetical protein